MALPAQNPASIGTGKNYSTIAAWEVDLDDANLDADYVGEAYGLTEDNSDIVFAGGNSTASYKAILRAASGEEPDGTDAKGAQVDVPLFIDEETNQWNMDIETIEFHTSGKIAYRADHADNIFNVLKCVFRDAPWNILGIYACGAAEVNIGVCLFRDMGAGKTGIRIADVDATVKVINCTGYNIENGLAEEYTGTFAAVKNCVSICDEVNASFIDYKSTPSNMSYCADSGDNTATGTGSIHTAARADEWVDYAADNFKVKDINAHIYHAGVQITGESWFPATDMAGVAWNNPPSMGCFEFEEAGVTLTVAELTGAGILDSFGLTQKHAITVQELLSGGSLDNIVLTQKHLLALQELLSSGALDSIVLIQKHLLTVQKMAGAGALDNVSLTQKHILAIQELLSSGALDNIDLIAAILLVVAELISSSTLDNIDLTQKHTLAIQELLSAGTLDNVELITAILLVVADLISSGTLDSKTLTQKHILAIQEMLGEATLDSINLTQKHLLAVQELLSSGTLDNVELSLAILLVVADLLSSGALDAKSLTQKHNIAIQELLSSGSLDVSTLTQKHILAVQELLSIGTLDALNLIAATLLVVADLVSSGALDSNVLTQKHILTVQEVLSTGLLDGVALTQKQLLAIQDLLSSGLIDSINFDIATGLICISLSKSTEYDIALSKSTEYDIALSKSTEYDIALSHKGGGVC